MHEDWISRLDHRIFFFFKIIACNFTERRNRVDTLISDSPKLRQFAHSFFASRRSQLFTLYISGKENTYVEKSMRQLGDSPVVTMSRADMYICRELEAKRGFYLANNVCSVYRVVQCSHHANMSAANSSSSFFRRFLMKAIPDKARTTRPVS